MTLTGMKVLLEDVDQEGSDSELNQNPELKKVKVLKVHKEKMQVAGMDYAKMQDVKNNDFASRVRLAL